MKFLYFHKKTNELDQISAVPHFLRVVAIERSSSVTWEREARPGHTMPVVSETERREPVVVDHSTERLGHVRIKFLLIQILAVTIWTLFSGTCFTDSSICQRNQNIYEVYAYILYRYFPKVTSSFMAQ